MTPLVTIAISLYNNEQQINRCIQSVLNQSYHNIEILVVNDGSTDSSKEKACTFVDNRISIVDKENGGLSSARQFALNLATGDFICFIDGDDYLLPDYVDKMLERIQRDHSDICICSTLFEDEDGQMIQYDTDFFKAQDFPKPIIGGKEKSIRYLFLSDSWNKMYRLSFLRNNQVSFTMPKGLNGTDRAYNMKLYVHQPLYSSISNQCYAHVIYKKSAVHRKNKDLLKSYMTIIDQVEKECRKAGSLPKFVNYLNIHYYLFLRSSFQDVFNESSNFFSIIKNFKSINKRHLLFIKDRAYLSQPIMNGTKSHLFFLRLFNHIKIALPAYFWMRKVVNNFHY